MQNNNESLINQCMDACNAAILALKVATGKDKDKDVDDLIENAYDLLIRAIDKGERVLRNFNTSKVQNMKEQDLKDLYNKGIDALNMMMVYKPSQEGNSVSDIKKAAYNIRDRVGGDFERMTAWGMLENLGISTEIIKKRVGDAMEFIFNEKSKKGLI